MKKVIVTRENYEEVMFNLLENTYSKEVSENIHDQINADAFLSFEWRQWSKATFSESIEIYKNNEAEFIENLTKEESRNKRLLTYWFPISIAASLILMMSLYFVLHTKSNRVPSVVTSWQMKQKKDNPSLIKLDTVLSNEKREYIAKNEIMDSSKYTTPFQNERTIDSSNKDYELAVISSNIINPLESQEFRDTISQMINKAQSKSRFKITIIESSADAIIPMIEVENEKRYSMVDVLNRKDGITLSKFFQNSTSRIVNDKVNNKVSIEYVAADHSVLVLNLSN